MGRGVCIVRGMVWCGVPVRGMGTLIWCMSCWNWPLRMPSRPSSEYGGPTSSAYMLATTWLVPATENILIMRQNRSRSRIESRWSVKRSAASALVWEQEREQEQEQEFRNQLGVHFIDLLNKTHSRSCVLACMVDALVFCPPCADGSSSSIPPHRCVRLSSPPKVGVAPWALLVAN